MAQNLVPKQLNFLSAFTQGIIALLQANDNLTSIIANWNGNSYATGASPTSDNITDTVISGGTPPSAFAYMTAAELNSAQGAVVNVQATIATNRGYLEAMRP
jgi:hypothetical protein